MQFDESDIIQIRAMTYLYNWTHKQKWVKNKILINYFFTTPLPSIEEGVVYNDPLPTTKPSLNIKTKLCAVKFNCGLKRPKMNLKRREFLN